MPYDCTRVIDCKITYIDILVDQAEIIGSGRQAGQIRFQLIKGSQYMLILDRSSDYAFACSVEVCGSIRAFFQFPYR